MKMAETEKSASRDRDETVVRLEVYQYVETEMITTQTTPP